MKIALSLLGCCLLIALLLSAGDARAECTDYGSYPRVLGSAAVDFAGQDYAVSGSYIFAARSLGGLRVIDISSPDSPVVIGNLDTPGYPRSLAADQRYVYFGCGAAGMLIIDVQDPAHPALVSTVPSPDDAYGVAIEGDILYFVDRQYGLYVVDVTDHTAPVVIGHLAFGEDARGIAVQGNYAYIGRTHGRDLYVVDVSDPAAPSLVADLAVPGEPMGLAVSGDFAYIANGSGGLTVVDISNPTAPAVIGSGALPEWADNVAVDGRFAFVMDSVKGLVLFDISRPEQPVPSGVFNLVYPGRGVAVVGGRAYLDGEIPSGRGIVVVDVASPRAVEVTGSVALPWPGMRVDAAGDFAFATTWQNGLIVIDATDPTAPAVVAQIHPLSEPSYMYSAVDVRDGYAYMAFGQNYIIIDVRDPAHPLLRRTLSMDRCDAAAAAFSGTHAFLLDACDRLWAADVSVPGAAQILGHIWMDDRPLAKDVAVVGRYAYVGGEDHMDIVDTIDPAHLTLAASVALPCPVERMTAGGTLLYVACPSSFCVLDVSDPLSPVTRGSVAIPEPYNAPLDVALRGSTIYLSDGGAGLLIIDVSNPDQPRIAGLMGQAGSANSVATSDTRVFMIDEDRLVVLPLQCEPAAAPEDAGGTALRPAFAAAPQPSDGEMTLRFDLTHGGPVSFDVIDAAGRHIRTLRADGARPGRNEIRWDGRDSEGRRVGSGAYFIRTQVDGRRETLRAVVLR